MTGKNAAESGQLEAGSIYKTSPDADEAVPFDTEPETHEEDDGESDFPEEGGDD